MQPRLSNPKLSCKLTAIFSKALIQYIIKKPSVTIESVLILFSWVHYSFAVKGNESDRTCLE